MCIFMVNMQFVTPIFHLFWTTNNSWMCSLSGLLMIQIFISFFFLKKYALFDFKLYNCYMHLEFIIVEWSNGPQTIPILLTTFIFY